MTEATKENALPVPSNLQQQVKSNGRQTILSCSTFHFKFAIEAWSSRLGQEEMLDSNHTQNMDCDNVNDIVKPKRYGNNKKEDPNAIIRDECCCIACCCFAWTFCFCYAMF